MLDRDNFRSVLLQIKRNGHAYGCRATFSELADSAIARTSENRIMNDCVLQNQKHCDIRLIPWHILD